MRVTTTCPLCQKDYIHLQQHLKKSHHLANHEELRLIVLYSSGRINGRLTCPHCAKDLVRLDKHFVFFHSLSALDRQAQLKRAKQQRVLELLAALRASHPPMLSSLDVQMSNKAEEHPDVPHNVPETPANDPAAPVAKTRSRTATSLSSGMKKYRITRKIADIAALSGRIRAMKYEWAPSRFVCGVTNSTAIKHKLKHLDHFLKWILKTRSTVHLY
ncbi:uncharacterized protein LOC131533426 [Onychostoma macrolepis]|uniref:Uncharacterized protein n=1 Tax=Onychostoma macrolepis TaxID=369639 RepID=A0A7J6BLF6_9TELE|nr:uncharacterized protein LOC131533426 [Onychostoma macrolepis]XP_058621737.1 uncharacterized protein LOC131533426 [Onychostoma macrolepis]XP_058621738.1 uncharacterized protein LOC131533426 [Onychostoma macrolepis]KAF4095726.1 hypothetical protein G5714_023329 [Onychostoma macrolepis]